MSNPENHEVPSIKYFGTSWYERGARYWRQRVWLSLLALLCVFVVVLIIRVLVESLFDGFRSPGARVVVSIAVAAAIVWSCYSSYLTLRRSPEDRALHRPMSFRPSSESSKRAAIAGGTAVGLVGGGPIIAIGSFFIVGTVLGFFIITLGKYINEEEWQLAREYGLEK